MPGTFYVDTTTDIYFQGHRLALDNSPINDAIVTATLAYYAQTGVITGATNATPIVVTSAGHGLSNGDEIVVLRVNGNQAANGVFTVANVTANTFELVGSVGDGAYVNDGTWYKTVPGASNLSLAYVAGSSGDYLVTIPPTLPIELGERCVLIVTSEVDGYIDWLEDPLPAAVARRG